MPSVTISQIIGLIGTLLVTLISGGLIGRWWSYRLNSRKLDGELADREDERRRIWREEARQDFEILLRVVTSQRDEALGKVHEQDGRLDGFELEVQGLRIARDLDPFPNWLVDLEGRFIFVNTEFEQTFLKPKGHNYRALIGKQHEEVFPAAFCERLRLLDIRARTSADKKARAVLEWDRRQFTVHKFVVCVRGAPVAFAGYITSIEEPEK